MLNRLTSSVELLSSAVDLYSRLPTKRVLRATSEKAASDVLIDTLFVAGKITSVRGGVNGRVRFVVLPPSPGWREGAVLQPVHGLVSAYMRD